jgi:hypothetical protein
MYISTEVAPQGPQLQRWADPKDPCKGVAHAVREFESQEETSTKVHRAWSGRLAAPTLAAAGRNKISISRSERRHTHRL